MHGSPFAWLISTAINLLFWIILINAILSWLIAFNVVNTRNQLVATIWDLTNRLINPLLRPIRSVLPTFNGVDLSPLVLLILLQFVERLLIAYVYPLLP
ncbi:YggT family protein [Elstera cyanobacteriorum]|uniref:YggT family protein n=1 Tax=Elstera cyanobacteriorum TaxID=2022747 RepID=UPI002355AA8C|nr:YggT family protein [Elstera cyanobacteriorum]MCK6441624.1 YggT family protein [Elstera cyanobacteriorum]